MLRRLVFRSCLPSAFLLGVLAHILKKVQLFPEKVRGAWEGEMGIKWPIAGAGSNIVEVLLSGSLWRKAVSICWRRIHVQSYPL